MIHQYGKSDSFTEVFLLPTSVTLTVPTATAANNIITSADAERIFISNAS